MPVYIKSDNIFSPLGSTTEVNFQQLLAEKTGIRLHKRKDIHPEPFYASLFEDIKDSKDFTRFEQMLIHSMDDAIKRGNVDMEDPKTAIIISTTKGNISLLENEPVQDHLLPLYISAKKIARYFKSPNKPIVVSNACISGLSALITGKRLLDAGLYKNVVVAGADAITSFVFSGFNAFMAISPEPCKPYDENRSGVTLGEAAATIVLSTIKEKDSIELKAGAGSNDANHISGPSRTGVELSMAIDKTLQQAALQPADIDFVSAHGTATIYNDDMESKAIHLSHLQEKPVNSLKGYYGHTLGAAGIIESVVALESLRNGVILPTKNYKKQGVSQPLQVANKLIKANLRNCLKTASGFGGCNAAVVFSR